jgi:hypothetical protein
MVPVITLACGVAIELVCNAVFGKKYYSDHRWTVGLTLLLSAVGCWFFTKYLERKPGRLVVDKATGQEWTLRPSHSVMAIPLSWWPAILALIGLGLEVAEFFK